jgi:hypothetical protein
MRAALARAVAERGVDNDDEACFSNFVSQLLEMILKIKPCFICARVHSEECCIFSQNVCARQQYKSQHIVTSNQCLYGDI